MPIIESIRTRIDGHSGLKRRIEELLIWWWQLNPTPTNTLDRRDLSRELLFGRIEDIFSKVSKDPSGNINLTGGKWPDLYSYQVCMNKFQASRAPKPQSMVRDERKLLGTIIRTKEDDDITHYKLCFLISRQSSGFGIRGLITTRNVLGDVLYTRTLDSGETDQKIRGVVEKIHNLMFRDSSAE